MPWTIKDVDKHNSGLTEKQKKQWVAVANSTMAACMKDGGTDATCAPKAIRIANGMMKQKESKLTEIIGWFSSIFGEPLTETSSWSLADTAAILSRDIKDVTRDCYVIDIFPDESLCICTNWRGGYYQYPYTLDETAGTATFGDPVEVTRKVTYVPTGEQEKSVDSMESADLDLSTNNAQIIPLVEKAVRSDGTVMLKLISPGWGSSGYYSEEVLKRDGPKVFTRGLHNLIDHPTAQEEAARPEGSINNLGSTLVEDAHWLDSYKSSSGRDEGPGLYAPAKVVPTFRETLNTIASDIGTSIRARGKARKGTIDGREGLIIESIDKALSVDYVTLPGRGGKVIELMESARNAPAKETNMTITDEEAKQLRESNTALAQQVARLQEGQAHTRALRLVENALKEYPTLPRATRERLSKLLPTQYTLDDRGLLDETQFNETIKNAITGEIAYLSSLGAGSVRGLGPSAHINDTPADELTYEKFAESLKALD